ncbi:TPA: retron Ec67 family RNA-directed DNA polymerase/endonuclease [Photobacterium damselae]
MINLLPYFLLKQAKSKSDLASALGVTPSFLTNVLYRQRPENLYTDFNINKKSGGKRTISAPSDQLKDLQRRLSVLLLNCKDAIHYNQGTKFTVSHGFEREKSIVSNAAVHRNKKNVLNLDLMDFFGTINFGRVKGFFEKNRNFALAPEVALTIAQIACYQGKLPQGSPCSPVIANLIANTLDMRLVKLAKKCGCSYTRYADDITFSTRKAAFPKEIVKFTDGHSYELGGKLVNEIKRAGFDINPDKTRVQYQNSRQDVTGLIVNKKVNVKSEYWREVRAMAHQQFKKGSFHIADSDGKPRAGELSELEGKLTFIDQVDKYNNIQQKKRPKSLFSLAPLKLSEHRLTLNSREKTYSRFLYYKYFYANNYPTILTEGKTDNVYLKCALNRLQKDYPTLVESTHSKTTQYKPKLLFPHLDKRTYYFLDLDGGATHFLRFIQRFSEEFSYFENQKPKSPVILVLDNDDGPKTILTHLAVKVKNCPDTVDEIRNKPFIHIFHNLYLVLTPLSGGQKTAMEDLFAQDTLQQVVDGKVFSRKDKLDTNKEYGKHIFSIKVVRDKMQEVDFAGFKPMFDAILAVNAHFSRLRF